MKVSMSALVMVALVVLVVDASPQAGAAEAGACPDIGPEVAMEELTDELCIHADKTKCDASMDSCRHHHKPAHNHPGDWQERMIANVTTCATELGFTFTPETEEKSSESAESCAHHYTFEKHLTDLGFTNVELVPMIRCLMTLKGTLETFKNCINE
ncbi:uncharacterized protein [Cherax quadricarinatus]|uniref:uncharacterized protein n=1 Tax=Cherax quadricarinatus TaxID=27406 RepID=UPI00387E32AE